MEVKRSRTEHIASPQKACVFDNCERYSKIGVQRIFVVDPDHRGAFEWQQERRQLVSIEKINLPNGTMVDLQKAVGPVGYKA